MWSSSDDSLPSIVYPNSARKLDAGARHFKHQKALKAALYHFWRAYLPLASVKESFLDDVLGRFGVGTLFEPVFFEHLFKLKVERQIATDHCAICFG